MRLAWAAIALCLAACGDDGAPRAPAPEPPPTSVVEASPSPAPPPPCEAEAPIVLRSLDATPSGVGIAMGDAGGLVLLRSGERTSAIPIDESGRASGEAMTIEGPTGDISALAAVDGGYVALFAARCEAQTCLVARFVAGDGRAHTGSARAALSTTWTRKQATLASALVLAFGHEDAPPEVLAFPFDGEVVRTVLGAPAETQTEVLGLTADGAGWAALYRVGAAEGGDSHVALVRSRNLAHETPPRTIEGLEEALAIESFAPGPDGLSVIASFEFSRPKLVVLPEEGESEPLLLAPAEPLPPPFVGRRRARARLGEAGLLLDVDDGAGDSVARGVLAVPDAGAVADVARLGPAAFIVAAARDDALVTTVVRCE